MLVRVKYNISVVIALCKWELSVVVVIKDKRIEHGCCRWCS